MSLQNNEIINHFYERGIKKLENESIRDYKMLIDYNNYKNIPELLKAYGINTRQIYNIKQKNNWNERIKKYEENCSKSFIKERFSEIHLYNLKRRRNLLLLADNVQDMIFNFKEYITMDPKSLKPTQTEDEIINRVRQSTRAMIDLQKLDTIIVENLKIHGIDLSPEFLINFEQEEILSENLLDYEEDTEIIKKSIHHTPEKVSKYYDLPEEEILEPIEKEKDETQSIVEENIINQVENFIIETKTKLKELKINPQINTKNNFKKEEDDEEEYYNEFALESHCHL